MCAGKISTVLAIGSAVTHRPSGVFSCTAIEQSSNRTKIGHLRRSKMHDTSGAARGGRGKLPPYGWTSKNYIICVCFHCHGTSSYHKTNTKPYKFPLHCSKCVSFWGTSYSRPPIDPYLTPPCYKILAAPMPCSDENVHSYPRNAMLARVVSNK